MSTVQAESQMYDTKFTTDYSTALDDLNKARKKIEELESTIEVNNKEHKRIIEKNDQSHVEEVDKLQEELKSW